MATMQVASQQAQPPLGPGSYPQESASRRQYEQRSPQIDNNGRSQSNSRTSPHSSKRPSRRPSGNTSNDAAAALQSSTPSQPSAATPPVPDLLNSAQTTPAASNPASSHQHRREPRGQQAPAGGPPISPPPRTSSNQRDPRSTIGGAIPDRTVHQRHDNENHDTQALHREDGEASSQALGDDREPDAAAAAANAARSRRRGPASPEGPQRAISTREAPATQSPTAQQSRSASHVISSPSQTRPTRTEAPVITRRVVDEDPAIDLEREEERQLESVPGLNVTNNVEDTEAPRSAPRSRQEFAPPAASSGRRKESKFGNYTLGQTLGEGEFGKVKLGWKKGSMVQVAIKLIRRETLGSNPSRLPKIHREISILETLQHPNIVKLHEMVETHEFIGIILEYASGGELFDYILNHRYLKDPVARKLFAQLVSGVGYLHKKGIIHRDLKLENLLLDRNRNIIITDFGFANTFNPDDELGEDIEQNLTNRDYVKKMDLERVTKGFRRGDLMATSCGSPCYAAPELVVTDSLYTGRKVDVWSCGVILYAMLAGYLPFDDDPANPEGDNINLLYKYITTTPLTFPEYVTPHARDLLRRILVPDPRKRADLFEVARHSWLSDFAHVVSQVTSNATTLSEIANTTVTASAQQESPSLVRSASVREPARATPVSAAASPQVGALSHQGKMDAGPSTEKKKAERNPNRRTVQVEYVPPQSQTVRGDPVSPIGSPVTGGYTSTPGTGPSKTRPRVEGPDAVAREYEAARTRDRSAPQSSRSSQVYQAQPSQGRTQRSGSSQQDTMAPPPRPPKDIPRAVSDHQGAFAQISPSTSGRPTTGGSMTPSGHNRLPSRGNSYSQPLAPAVITANAQGRVTQPQNEGRYNISAPIPQSDDYNQADSIGLPSTEQYAPPPTLGRKDPPRGHKRSNTLGNFFRTASISGPRSQPQSPRDTPLREKKHPPTSMKTPIANDTPRKSSDSRRPSFSFSRKNSDLRNDTELSKEEKRSSRRFSLLPASFSFKSLSTTSHGKDQPPDNRPGSERRPSNYAHTAPASRTQSRPQTMAYSRGQSQVRPFEEGDAFDGGRDRNASQQTRRADRNQQMQYGSLPNQDQRDFQPPTKLQQTGQSYLGTPTESEISLQPRSQRQAEHRPVYPPGFGNDQYDDEPRTSMQEQRPARGPSVLQKPNRRFADAYEDRGPGEGNHAGSSGAAKRVMDFFRRRGRARGGEQ